MGCNSKENTLKELDKRGVIDSSKRLILNYPEFVRLNLNWSNQALQKFNIAGNKHLFEIQTVKTKDSKTSTYRRDSIATKYFYVPNQEIFEEIDRKKDALENDYLPDGMTSNDDILSIFDNYTNLRPDFENYISFKEELASSLLNRLKTVRNLKKVNATNKVELEKLLQEEKALEDRIEGNKETVGIQAEIEELKKTPDIDRIEYYAEKDFKRLDKLVESSLSSDIQEAKKIISFYEKMTFKSDQPHPFFDIDQIISSTGEPTISQELTDIFEELSQKTKKYSNKLHRKSKDTLLKEVNSLVQVQETVGELTEADILSPEGLKDASWGDMLIMDVTNGIWSDNGLLPQVAQITLTNGLEKHTVKARDMIKRVDEATKEVEKALPRKKILGASFVDYDIFLEKTDNGNQTGNFVQRFSSSYDKVLKKHKQTHYKLVQQAIKSKKPEDYLAAYQYEKNWKTKNEVVINPTKLSLFKDNAKYKGEETSTKYEAKLKEILGETGYQEAMEIVERDVKAYEVEKELLEDKKEYLSEEDYKSQLKYLEEVYNPFTVAEQHEATAISSKTLIPNYKYVHSIPRKNKIKVIGDKKLETTESTGFYNENFAAIEAKPELKKFHDLIVEVNEYMRNSLSEELNQKLGNSLTLGQLNKSVTEILLSGHDDIFTKIFKTLIPEVWGRFKKTFGIDPNFLTSLRKRNSITGELEYSVDSSFLKTNKQQINARTKIEMLRLKALIPNFDTSPNIAIAKLDPEVLNILAEIYQIEPTIEALHTAVPTYSLDTTNLFDIVKEGITHQVVTEASMDIPKMMKFYASMTGRYAARQEVLPTMQVLKDHYQAIKNGKDSFLDKERSRSNMQFESWFQRNVLGDDTSKSEFGDTTFKNKETTISTEGKFGKIKKALQKSNEEGILKSLVSGKITDSADKALLAKIKELKQSPTNEKDLEFLNKLEKSIGKDFAATALFDNIFRFIRYKALGWSLSSGVTNFMEGQFANHIVASSGLHFNADNIWKANRIAQKAFVKNLTFGKVRNPLIEDAFKLRTLVDKTDMLQDASNELQKASARSAYSQLTKLSPMEISRRVEYLNQSPLMISLMLDEKVKSKEGKENNVWEILDSDGKVKEEYRTEENIENWENFTGEKYKQFKAKLTKLIVDTHGDYDEFRGTMFTTYTSGKAIGMFKKWLPKQIYTRFARPQTDLELGIKEFKGRYRSHTAVSGAMQGAVVGFLFAGPVGAGIGATLGGGIGAKYGAKSDNSVGMLQQIGTLGKELLLSNFRFGVNTVTGKGTIKSADFSKLGYGELDTKNLQAILTETAILTTLVALQLLVKAGLYDEDDEKNSARAQTHNLLINKLVQLSDQSVMYLDPRSWKSTVGDFPILRFFSDLEETGKAVQKTFEGSPMEGRGGEHRIKKSLTKLIVPGVFKGLGFKGAMKRPYKSMPYDDWFKSDETLAKSQARAMRKSLRVELLDEGYSKKETEKLVDEILPPKKRNEGSYVELLEEYKKVR